MGTAGAASAVTESGQASTSGYDGKSYTGAFCQSNSGVNTAFGIAPWGFLSNGAQGVVCPIIKDDWQSSAGLSYARISFHPSWGISGVSCSLQSYAVNGAGSFTNGSAASNVLYFTPYPATGIVEGAYLISCNMPSGPRGITSYAIQEI